MSKLIVDIAKSELSNCGLDHAQIQDKCRASLDSVLLSVVFDIDGIWQTISELLQPRATVASPSFTTKEGSTSSLNPERYMPAAEIQDSEDEDLSQSVGHDRISSQDELGALSHDAHDERSPVIRLPEIIVVTHFSTLLTSLFARREKTAAHKSLALLRARLRGLSSSASTSPLLLLVNSTTDEATNKHKEPTADFSGPTVGNKRTEPTLRSIFSSVRGLRPSRPSFGGVFNQFLDLHLLCTDISNYQATPSCSLEKAEESANSDYQRRSPTLVEVLQDNVGLDSPPVHQHHREQRWAVLEVSNHQIVNAYAHGRQPNEHEPFGVE